MGREIVPNSRLVAARKALLSPSGSGRPMSRQELADACNAVLATMPAVQGGGQRWAGLTEKTIGALERGEIRWPNDDYRQALCTVLVADERSLSLYIDRPTETHASKCLPATSPDLDHAVRRREFLPMATAAVGIPRFPELADALLGGLNAAAWAPSPSADALRQQARRVKTLYQACDYENLLAHLPLLLAGVTAAQQQASPESVTQVHEVGAAAFHVVASFLLKSGDHPMALLAARRSTQHAHASGHPVTIAASARIMAHALANDGHPSHAVELAERAAQRLHADTGLNSPNAASVYGALVLRAAVAAARLDDRETASSLLDEGDRAAARLGHDGNHYWTGFGSSNVLLHRVNIALTLGDAGTAIHLARKVNVERVQLTERKVSLYLDIAQAYTQWGRHTQALRALRGAYSLAPQEVHTRPTARRIVKDLIAVSSGTERSEAIRFATTAKLPL